MTKRRRTAGALLAAALLAAICVFRSAAGYFSFEPDEESERDPKEYYGDLAEALPDDIRSALFVGDDVPDGAPWQSAISAALGAISDELFPALGKFGALAAVCVLCSALGAISRGVLSPSLGRAAPFLSRCAIVSAALSGQLAAIEFMRSAVDRLVSVVSAMVPALTALCAASGAVTSAALGSAGFAALCAIAADGFALVCLPALRASLALGAVGGALGSKTLAAVAKFIRTSLGVILTAGMTLFVFFFNLQMHLAKAADGAAYRAVRLAISSFVPVVGGQVADASSQIGASLSLIRASCGAIAVCAALVLTVPMIVRLAADRAVLFVCRHIVGAISPQSGEDALEELGSTCTTEIAAAIAISVAFILCLAAFVTAATAL